MSNFEVVAGVTQLFYSKKKWQFKDRGALGWDATYISRSGCNTFSPKEKCWNRKFWHFACAVNSLPYSRRRIIIYIYIYIYLVYYTYIYILYLSIIYIYIIYIYIFWCFNYYQRVCIVLYNFSFLPVFWYYRRSEFLNDERNIGRGSSVVRRVLGCCSSYFDSLAPSWFCQSLPKWWRG